MILVYIYQPIGLVDRVFASGLVNIYAILVEKK